MTDEHIKAAVGRALDAGIGDREAQVESLPRADQAEVRALLEVADLLWVQAHGAPPLREDPVAAMLGLVPDEAHALDANGLRAALDSAALTVSEVAARLAARGWDVKTRDVFNWQSGRVTDVPPALIQALADVTRSRPERLTTTAGKMHGGAIAAVAATPRFRALAERWALMMRTSLDLASSALESRLAMAVYRGDTPDPDQMLDVLEVVVDHLEEGRRE